AAPRLRAGREGGGVMGDVLAGRIVPRGEVLHPPNLTDLGNATRFAREHGKDVRFCWSRGCFFVWDGRRWRVDDTGEAQRRAKETIREMRRRTAEGLKKAEGEEAKRLQKTLDQCLKFEAAPRLNALLDLARSEPGIPVLPDELDADPWLLNCGNG